MLLCLGQEDEVLLSQGLALDCLLLFCHSLLLCDGLLCYHVV